MNNSSSAIETQKDVEAIKTTNVYTNGANDQDARGIRFVPRGEAMPEASSSQESIAGYDAELMSGRTLLSAEEEKKLLRKIDWRLMTLCSLIFMFKQLDSQNNHESGNKPQHHDTIRLFLVEGLATVLFGSIIWFVLPDFPETASWLTEREKKFIQARLPANAPRATEANFNLSEIFVSLRDKRLWLFTLIWATFTVGTQGVTFYQSTVIADLGFSTIAQAQLLNLPITVTALLIIAVTGIMADRRNIPRPLYPLTFLVIIIICYGVFVAHPSSAAIYAVTLIGNAVTAAWFPVMWPWRVQTTSHATGSAFSIGFVNSYGQIGGALGPQIFRSRYGPRYTVPFCVAMGLLSTAAINPTVVSQIHSLVQPSTWFGHVFLPQSVILTVPVLVLELYMHSLTTS
ncbi:hypothetical protein MY5147_002813 [Beauveria neobassiana]